MKSFYSFIILSMKYLVLIAVLPILLAWKSVDRIILLVKNTPISSIDLDNEKNFLLFLSGKTINRYHLNLVDKQAIHNIIEDTLKEKEIHKYDINISDQQISAAIKDLAQENGYSVAQLYKKLTTYHISKSFFRKKTRLQLAWKTLIIRKYMPQIIITNEQIDNIYNQQKIKNSILQKHIIDLFIPTFNRKEIQQAIYQVKTISEQIKNKKNFKYFVRKYSKSPYKHGDLGWTQPSMFEPQLQKEINKLQVGDISSPIITSTGVHLLQNIDQRIIFTKQHVDSVMEIVIPLKLSTSIHWIQKSIVSCNASGNLQKKFPQIHVKHIVNIIEEKIPTPLYETIRQLKTNQISKPFYSKNGIILLALCQRHIVTFHPMRRQEIKQMLIQKQLVNYEKQYLSNLKEQSYIESHN